MKYEITRLSKIFLYLVILKAGLAKHKGNVYTLNPITGQAGYVCDDSWDLNAVSNKHRP